MIDLSGLYPEPTRMTWREKLELNALGLIGIILLVVLGFGVVGLIDWIGKWI